MASAKALVDWSSRLSPLAHRLKVGPMKRLYKYYTPTAINLAGGVPMEKCFPIDSLSFGIHERIPGTLEGKNSDVRSIHLKRGDGLSLNYQRGDGIPALRDWIGQHVTKYHAPPSPKPTGSCVSVGSTDALSKTLTLLHGNATLFDEFAYGTASATAQVLGRRCVGVAGDAEGMLPEELKKRTLLARSLGLVVDSLYVIPIAQNPTGVTMSLQRKQEIYNMCRELDLIVIEDDAYYQLDFGEIKGSSSSSVGDAKSAHAKSTLPGLYNLPKSFLSLDTDGRVIRFDSLSKSVAPGMRLGWVVGPEDFVTKYQLLQEMTSQFPSGLTQSAFGALVHQWGDEGLHQHLLQLQAHYKMQRDVMCEALKANFTPEQARWVEPTGGMFVWLELLQSNQPSEEIFKQLAASGCIVVPGGDFRVRPMPEEVEHNGGAGSMKFVDPPIVRLTYAATQPNLIKEGIARLAKGILQSR